LGTIGTIAIRFVSAERDEHEKCHERQPAAEQEQLALRIAQFGCAEARAGA
jgi:hypothetical protein